jgi:G:T-mismatch repair DNA endonuclease (very short patch repair protein)
MNRFDIFYAYNRYNNDYWLYLLTKNIGKDKLKTQALIKNAYMDFLLTIYK